MLDEFFRTPISPCREQRTDLDKHLHKILTIGITRNRSNPLILLFTESGRLQNVDICRNTRNNNAPIPGHLNNNSLILWKERHFLTFTFTIVLT